MKNILIILGVISVIIAIHVGLIFWLIRPAAAPVTPAAPGTTATAPASGVPAPAPGTAPVTTPQLGLKPGTTPSVPTPAKLGTQTENVNQMGKPLNYQKAVNGDIREIPDSKIARSGILVDMDTREVLWAKNPKQQSPIASMTKMMTALIVFEELEKNKAISMDSMIPVSATSKKIGGSQVYLDTRESFTLRELMKAVMIKSANDASELVAEFIGNGDRMTFVNRMNQRAQELKMVDTYFYNPHGLPHGDTRKENYASPEGLVFLAERLLVIPEAMEMAGTRLDYFRKDSDKQTELRNHNKLVGSCPGVDGMKTGFTNKAGFCTTITCKRNGRRLIAVVTGYESQKQRDLFVRKLLDWGYSRGADFIQEPVSEKSEPAKTTKPAATAKTESKKTAPAAASKTSSSKTPAPKSTTDKTSPTKN